MKTLCVGMALLLSCAAPAFAAGLADRVQAAYRKTDMFSADFVQKTRVELLDREIEESGQLLFSKPGKFLIHYQGKNERQYISDGLTLWIYHPRDKEVEVVEHVPDMISREALVFLGGLGDMTKEFKVEESKSDQLVLEPKSKTSPFSKLILTIAPDTSLVSAVTLFPKSGNRSDYAFTNVRTNGSVPESTFQFKKSGVKTTRPLDTP